MIPFSFRSPVSASPYWRADWGHWVPVHRRVPPPARWLRYPLGIILLASAIWFAEPLWQAEADPAAGVVAVVGPCHTRAGAAAMPLFAEREGHGDD